MPCFFFFLFSGNGEIDFAEFVQMMKKHLRGIDHERELKEAFDVFDYNGNGRIRYYAICLWVYKSLEYVSVIKHVQGAFSLSYISGFLILV